MLDIRAKSECLCRRRATTALWYNFLLNAYVVEKETCSKIANRTGKALDGRFILARQMSTMVNLVTFAFLFECVNVSDVAACSDIMRLSKEARKLLLHFLFFPAAATV